MAIYHCSIQKGKRSDGRSAVACSAYRSGERYTDQETGIVFDYSWKKAVVHHEIFLPEYAPAAYQSAETLWNAVQEVENKSNAVLFREFEVALPIEIDLQERISCAQEFCRILQAEGMCVQLDIHNLSHNPHAHIMCTTRKIKKDGKWDAKEKKDYVYVRDEDGRPVIGEDGKKVREPLIDPETGKQKVRIRKGKGAEKLWKTEKTEANEWNKRYKVEEWRMAWAETCNKYIDEENKKRKEKEEREIDHVDHRSYERQEIEQIPTIHEGYQARAIERRGEISERMEENRNIRRENRIMEENAVSLLDKMSNIVEEIGRKINGIKRKVRGIIGKSQDSGNGDRGAAGRAGGSDRANDAGKWTATERIEREGGTDLFTGRRTEGSIRNGQETTEESGGLEENRRRLGESERELENKSRGTGEESGRIGERSRETAGMLEEIERREQGSTGVERQEQGTGERKQKISRINNYVEQQIQQLEQKIGRLAELKKRKAVETKEKEAVSDTERETSGAESTLVPQVLLEKIAGVRELFLQERIKAAQKAEQIKAHEEETKKFREEATKDRDNFKKDLAHAERMKTLYVEELERTPKIQFMKRNGIKESIQNESEKIERLGNYIKDEEKNLEPKYAELYRRKQIREQLEKEMKAAQDASSEYRSQFRTLCAGMNDMQKAETYEYLQKRDAERSGAGMKPKGIRGKLSQNREIIELDESLRSAYLRVDDMKKGIVRKNRKHWSL